MRALSSAATGMLAQQLNVDVISNNLANVNTTGFKRQRTEFQDLLYQTLQRPGAQSSNAGTTVPTGIQVGAGVRAGSTYRIVEQGGFVNTEGRFDVAISGDGFFVVDLPDGTQAYTRAGNFAVNQDGQLVTDDGFLLNPAITVPNDAIDVVIARDGVVQAIQPGGGQPQNVGQIQLATFVNPAGLDAIGDNLLLETEASGPPTLGNPAELGIGTLTQGFLEGSNVNAVQEITGLITAQRAYELNARVITTADEMLQQIGSLQA